MAAVMNFGCGNLIMGDDGFGPAVNLLHELKDHTGIDAMSISAQVSNISRLKSSRDSLNQYITQL